jgi:hypothetical protein
VSPDEWYPDGPYRPAHWPDWARDEIFTHVTVHFDWTDRLLILLGRPVSISVRTVVGASPGRCASKTSAWAQRVRWPWQKVPGGYLESDGMPSEEGTPTCP